MAGTLLITDDALIIREIIKDTAEQAGWEVVGQATNGQEAIDLYELFKPDAMTLDMVMPKYDGLYALRAIMAAYPEAVIVVVSALDQKDVLKEAFKIGAADFIVKPFDKQVLLETLEQATADTDQVASGAK